ncbi:uncharacterized protein [Fopius arisanus]|uniref:Uncharacterized protein isoform X1 n=2 Tax=Fopius arisanus TaxID=64838 RepID=A0A9R1U1J5_9HYME|nr:PREDICTED: uncharacterized protein LOC105266989 isoform X1 [Fopius arisanus]
MTIVSPTWSSTPVAFRDGSKSWASAWVIRSITIPRSSDFVSMTSKVLVKLPTVPFTQGKKPASELVTLPARSEGQIRAQGMTDRAALLEQNMKFLQEQHQATLIALHQEVEILRQRNRDLQFQLVFTKGTACASSPSSPEDNSNGFVKSKGSPVSVNVTPLQIELLERDLEELRVSFNETKKHNQHLQEVIDEQKIELEKTDQRKEQTVSDVGIQVGDTQEVHNDLATRLVDAEALVKRLRRENADQQREIASMKTASAKSGNRSGHGRGRANENPHHSRGASGDPGQSNRHPYKFPPLEGESYWRNTSRGRGSYEHHPAHYQRRNRLEDEGTDGDMSCIVLPELRIGSMKNEAPCYPPMYRSQRGYHNGGNYYRDSGNRKFRGQGRQRRDQDYKDRNQKGQQQGEYNDAPHTSKKN